MTDVIEAIGALRAHADELDQLSQDLAGVERALEPVATEFQAFVDDFELGLYQRSISEDDFKLPAEALRFKLAVRAMPPELFGRHTALAASRDRLEKRIAVVKKLVEAQRSILSAQKEVASV